MRIVAQPFFSWAMRTVSASSTGSSAGYQAGKGRTFGRNTSAAPDLPGAARNQNLSSTIVANRARIQLRGPYLAVVEVHRAGEAEPLLTRAPMHVHAPDHPILAAWVVVDRGAQEVHFAAAEALH